MAIMDFFGTLFDSIISPQYLQNEEKNAIIPSLTVTEQKRTQKPSK